MTITATAKRPERNASSWLRVPLRRNVQDSSISGMARGTVALVRISWICAIPGGWKMLPTRMPRR